MNTCSEIVERNSKELPSSEDKACNVNVILLEAQIIHTGAALSKDIVSWIVLFADMFGFRVLSVVLSIRINHRNAIVWEIYGKILQSDVNLFSLIICMLPVYVTPSQLVDEYAAIKAELWEFSSQLSFLPSVSTYTQTVRCINRNSRYFIKSCVLGCVGKVKQFQYECLLLLGIWNGMELYAPAIQTCLLWIYAIIFSSFFLKERKSCFFSYVVRW